MGMALGIVATGQYQLAMISNALTFNAMAGTLGTPMARGPFPFLLRIHRVRCGKSGSCMFWRKDASASQRPASVPSARRSSCQSPGSEALRGIARRSINLSRVFWPRGSNLKSFELIDDRSLIKGIKEGAPVREQDVSPCARDARGTSQHLKPL